MPKLFINTGTANTLIAARFLLALYSDFIVILSRLVYSFFILSSIFLCRMPSLSYTLLLLLLLGGKRNRKFHYSEGSQALPARPSGKGWLVASEGL